MSNKTWLDKDNLTASLCWTSYRNIHHVTGIILFKNTFSWFNFYYRNINLLEWAHYYKHVISFWLIRIENLTAPCTVSHITWYYMITGIYIGTKWRGNCTVVEVNERTVLLLAGWGCWRRTSPVWGSCVPFSSSPWAFSSVWHCGRGGVPTVEPLLARWTKPQPRLAARWPSLGFSFFFLFFLLQNPCFTYLCLKMQIMYTRIAQFIIASCYTVSQLFFL